MNRVYYALPASVSSSCVPRHGHCSIQARILGSNPTSKPGLEIVEVTSCAAVTRPAYVVCPSGSQAISCDMTFACLLPACRCPAPEKVMHCCAYILGICQLPHRCITHRRMLTFLERSTEEYLLGPQPMNKGFNGMYSCLTQGLSRSVAVWHVSFSACRRLSCNSLDFMH